MGVEKTYRAQVSTPAQTLGSTGGTIKAFPPVTVITSTATGTVYTLPTPRAGMQKTVVIDYTGATGALSVVNGATGTVFNGTTGNIITVSSSETMLVYSLVGVSSSQWALSMSTGSGATVAGSTVTG